MQFRSLAHNLFIHATFYRLYSQIIMVNDKMIINIKQQNVHSNINYTNPIRFIWSTYGK